MAMNKHCPIKDPRQLMSMKFPDFIDLKQFVDILTAQEQAFYIDEETERELKKNKR